MTQDAASGPTEAPEAPGLHPSLLVQTPVEGSAAEPGAADVEHGAPVSGQALPAGKELPPTGQPLPPDVAGAGGLPPDDLDDGSPLATLDPTLSGAGDAEDTDARRRHAAHGPSASSDAAPDGLTAVRVQADLPPQADAGLVAALIARALPDAPAAASNRADDGVVATVAPPESAIDSGIEPDTGAAAPRYSSPSVTADPAVMAARAPVGDDVAGSLPPGLSLAGVPLAARPAASATVAIVPGGPVDPGTGLVTQALRQGAPGAPPAQTVAGGPTANAGRADVEPVREVPLPEAGSATAGPADQPGASTLAAATARPSDVPGPRAEQAVGAPADVTRIATQPDLTVGAAKPAAITRDTPQAMPLASAVTLAEPATAMTAAAASLRNAATQSADEAEPASGAQRAQPRKADAQAADAGATSPVPLVPASPMTPPDTGSLAADVAPDIAINGAFDRGNRNPVASDVIGVSLASADSAPATDSATEVPAVAASAARMARAPIELAARGEVRQADDALDLPDDPGSPQDWLRAIGSERALMPQAQHLPLGTPALSGAEAAKSVPAPLSLFAANAGGDTWGEEIGQRILWMSGRALKSAHIQLDPPELGPLQVRVSNEAGGTSIHFTTHSAAVRDIVEQSLPRLRDMLESSGTQLVDVNVAHQQGRGEQSARDLAWGARGGMPAGDIDADEGFVTATTPARLPLGLVDQFV